LWNIPFYPNSYETENLNSLDASHIVPQLLIEQKYSMTKTKKAETKNASGYRSPTAVLDADPFFCDIKALSKLYATETDARNKTKVKYLRKLPMLIPDDFDPLNTILVCRHPEERILILKEMGKTVKHKKITL